MNLLIITINSTLIKHILNKKVTIPSIIPLHILASHISALDLILCPIAPITAINGKMFKEVKGKADNQFCCSVKLLINSTCSSKIKRIEMIKSPMTKVGTNKRFNERKPSTWNEKTIKIHVIVKAMPHI